jgi:hypothetical protein
MTDTQRPEDDPFAIDPLRLVPATVVEKFMQDHIASLTARIAQAEEALESYVCAGCGNVWRPAHHLGTDGPPYACCPDCSHGPFVAALSPKEVAELESRQPSPKDFIPRRNHEYALLARPRNQGGTGMSTWVDVSFTRDELRFLVEVATENWGRDFGQRGTDLHERFDFAYTYVREALKEEPE